MRQSDVPFDRYTKTPVQQVELKASKDTMDGGQENFYHENSSTPSVWSERDRPIRNAEDYEAYAMRQLSRHAYNGSTLARGSVAQDWSDPGRRYDADNSV